MLGISSWRKTKNIRVRQMFHAVEVVPEHNSCAAAHAMVGQKVLSDEAQHLPLLACDRIEICQCRFRHYADRREDARRDHDVGLPVRRVDLERRGNAGRRITDG